jgi:UDP-N-acetylmuramate dehydrogenase
VTAGGAAALPVLARRLAEQGLRGLEWGVGVPGSVGGAVRMNAGGHGSDVASSLVSAGVFSLATGESAVRPSSQLGLSYRHSDVRGDEVVTSATFRLEPGDPDESRAQISEIVRWRRANQPGGSNAGSVFTNPPGDAAGRLVEAVGAKGRRHGTAHVSDKHANFIQADEGGSADDVYSLIDEVRALVLRETGVSLATELVTVGFGGTP